MSEYLNSAKEAIKSNIPTPEGITSGISGTADSIRSATQSATEAFSSRSAVNAGNEFLNSNSMIARFVFVILVLIVFMFFLNLGIGLVSYFTAPSTSPYIIHGQRPGNNKRVYQQTPGNGNPVIYRSNNQTGGVEFTWSMWLKITTVPTRASGDPQPSKNVFVKGDGSKFTQTIQVSGITYGNIANVNNGPGVYVIPYKDPADTTRTDENSAQAGLLFLMDVVSPIDSNVQQKPFAAVIPNLPVGNWFHVAIRLQNKMLDCYMNGIITQRVSFQDWVPKQNYDDITYGGNEGFPGTTSNLRYYDRALSVFEINSIVYYGPNLKSDDTSTSSFFDYLGQPWYSYGSNNALIKTVA
jgi:hypothetical protein